jgi:hypothetical protein
MFDRDTDQRAEMKNRWLAMELYRLRCAEVQPDSPYKRATVAAIRSAMEAFSGRIAPVEPSMSKP